MRFMIVTKERVDEAMPDPNSVVLMFKYMESPHKAGVLLAQQRHSHRSGQQHAFSSCEARFGISMNADTATSGTATSSARASRFEQIIRDSQSPSRSSFAFPDVNDSSRIVCEWTSS